MPDLQIEVVRASRLSAPARAEVLALCDRAYGKPIAPYLADLAVQAHLLGRVDGELVCHAAWVTRYLQAAEQPPMRTAYVELVATNPAHQRRGYAAAIMSALAAAIIDYDLGALCPSDAGADLYTRFGWRYWRGPLSIRTEAGPLPTPDERVMVLPLPATSVIDLDAPLSAEWRPGELW